MTILVPFDGSKLSEAALVRATALGETFEEEVLAVAIVPKNDAEYARDHGWLDPDEEFDMETVVGRLRRRVADVTPAAEFRHEPVGRFASAGTIATELRRTAKAADVSLVAIGSDNAGHLVTSIHSVGSNVASDEAFDVLIVRTPTAAEGSADSSGW